MNEMTATTREGAQNAEEASGSAQGCEQLTREGGSLVRNNIKQTEDLADEVKEAAQAIVELKEDSDNTGSVLGVIAGIVGQAATASEETLQSNQELSRLGVELQELASQFKLGSAR
ncbi:hypothetical protein [Saccharospirillum impatiens]|uniref:hypothetical protein n=1 Tax=Saccharospirillum impatiens TaxID=169438 RepID=UPI0012F9FE0E|nr:hypothetical protein [Saccharospirillum impatiens]